MLATVIRHQWRLLLRDNRVRAFALVLFAATAAAFASGVASYQRWTAEREAAVQADADAWRTLGVTNPHNAAHFGRYAFKPISVLSAFDPGLLDHLGTVVRLEAHRQHAASGLPTDAGTALTSFAPFTVAAALQIFAPVLLILAAFATFSGDAARQLLRQELAAGVNPRTLMFGRMLALSTGVAALLLVLGTVGAALLSPAGLGAGAFLRLALMLAGYALHLLAILAVALAVSARCRSARTSLASLLGFWLITALVVPRLAPALAASRHPAPSAPQFQDEVAETIDARLDAGDPQQSRADKWRALALEKYGVGRIEDLPVNFTGFVLEQGEDFSTEAYRRHFAELQCIHSQQERMQRVFSLLAPVIALKGWSAALAGTDFAAHQRFLTAAEDHRYELVQALNRDVLHHRPTSSERAAPYETDVARITGHIGNFEAPSVDLGETWQRAWPHLLILAGWLAVAVMVAGSGARQLRAGL